MSSFGALLARAEYFFSQSFKTQIPISFSKSLPPTRRSLRMMICLLAARENVCLLVDIGMEQGKVASKQLLYVQQVVIKYL